MQATISIEKPSHGHVGTILLAAVGQESTMCACTQREQHVQIHEQRVDLSWPRVQFMVQAKMTG
eukprot:896246-Amphidinium_carterae.1